VSLVRGSNDYGTTVGERNSIRKAEEIAFSS
jgi:hypothetical protein